MNAPFALIAPGTGPPLIDHVTAVFTVPVTEAEKVWLVPNPSEMDVGLCVMATAGTVTVALAVLLESALLVATTWKVPAAFGAVYLPVLSMVPPPFSCTAQLTAVFCDPETFAVKGCVPP